MGCDFCGFISANGIAKQSFYRGDDCIEKLLDTLRDWFFWCYKEKHLIRRLRISTQQREQLLNMTNVMCCICGKGVETPARVIHHCHLSGTIFGVIHSNCNLRDRTKKFLPIVFHNLSRYDAHHILKQLKLKANEERSTIAKTDQTFISLRIKKAKRAFREFAWITSAPGQQSTCLLKHGKSCKNTQGKWFLNTEAVFFQHSWSFVCQTHTEMFISLQLSRQFWRIQRTASYLWWLLGKHFTGPIDIPPPDYQHAMKIYQEFGCRNLGDYHDIFLKTDVHLLADIFEKFRNVCLNVYTLDPSHFYYAPNLNWEFMLISTNVKLGLLKDIE